MVDCHRTRKQFESDNLVVAEHRSGFSSAFPQETAIIVYHKSSIKKWDVRVGANDKPEHVSNDFIICGHQNQFKHNFCDDDVVVVFFSISIFFFLLLKLQCSNSKNGLIPIELNAW